MTLALIEIENLTKRYDDTLAVDHISFRVHRGEVFGFLGPNGAGKTTTLNMLTGLTTPSEGTARVAGFDIRDDIVEVKRRVGARAHPTCTTNSPSGITSFSHRSSTMSPEENEGNV